MKIIIKLVFIVLIYAAVSANVISAEQAIGNMPENLSGAYFGQKPPGTNPELFAPGIISTEAYEMTPTFSPNLDELFFTQRTNEASSDNKIYHTKLVDNLWQKPVLASFTEAGMEFEAQFSCDGQKLFFGREMNLYSTEKTDAGWSKATLLPAPVSEGMCASVDLNANLYFTARRSTGYGLFKSVKINDKYQEPKLIIPGYAHPFVAPDESYLLCDKYVRDAGKRTSSIFVSFKNNDNNWTDPVRLGPEINKVGAELLPKVSPDGKYLFFQRKINNNSDIYWVSATVIEALRAAKTTND